MELSEYESILSELDAKIIGAKERLEKKTRREALEKRLREIVHKCSTLDSRIASLKQFGEEADERVLDFAARLHSEADAIRTEIFSFDPEAARKKTAEPSASNEPPRPLDAAEKKTLLELMNEIETAPPNSLETPPEENGLLVVTWAIRWRILADEFGYERTRMDRDAQKCYGLISEARKKHLPNTYVAALNRESSENWKVLLEQARLNLKTAQDNLVRQRESERQEEKKILELKTLMKVLPGFQSLRDATGSGEERTFRHLVRELAKNEERRPELAELCRPYRNTLESEFAFLWKDEDAAEDAAIDTSRHMTNREIVQRLLGRMIRKGIIGGRTAPTDMLLKGFPPHDLGRAKEAFNLLVKAEIIKLFKEGDAAAITADVCKQAKALVDGATSGITAVDTWIKT